MKVTMCEFHPKPKEVSCFLYLPGSFLLHHKDGTVIGTLRLLKQSSSRSFCRKVQVKKVLCFGVEFVLNFRMYVFMTSIPFV